MGTTMRPFSDRLREAAHYAGIEYSQTEIAKSLGVSRQAVHRWMTDGEPRPAMVFHIADTWNVSARWLATDQGSMHTPPGGTGLPSDEVELLRGYRKASQPHRATLRVMAKSLSKAIVALAFLIPGFRAEDAHAGVLHNVFPRVIHICAQLWRRLHELCLPALQA